MNFAPVWLVRVFKRVLLPVLQDKMVAVAKFLRGKLAKAPAHKQPLHTQVRQVSS